MSAQESKRKRSAGNRASARKAAPAADPEGAPKTAPAAPAEGSAAAPAVPAVPAEEGAEAQQAQEAPLPKFGDYPTMSTAVLKALSNPLRRRVMNTLSHLGSGRAADIAKRLELPANKVSFHLRVLAEAGLIVEDSSLARDSRDRVWVPVRGGRSIGSPEDPVKDPALGDAVLTGLVEDQTALLHRVAAWARAYTLGEDKEIRGTLSDMSLRLTPDRFNELVTRMGELVEEYRDDPRTEETLGWDVVIMGASEEV